jgi:hypothetical protein
VVEGRQAHFPTFVHHCLGGAVDQRRDVLDAIARILRCFSLEIIRISNRIDQLAQQLVDAGFLRALAKTMNEIREVAQRFLRPTANTSQKVRPSGCLRESR